VWGDGVVPVASAHLEGARNITLENCYHSPLGAFDDNDNNDNSNGGVLESESDAENFGLIENKKSNNRDDVSVFQASSSGPGPRLWYGSKPILDQWINELN